jgi:prepilin-type N-terminal cleavage/methylation domain-containing protein
MSRSAFTLVELLVVVVIIVVLLALLTPAVDRAMNFAYSARCASNLHGVGVAMRQYLLDHKSRYPQLPTYYALMGNRGVHYAPDVTTRPLNAYLGYRTDGSSIALAECPSDKGDSVENPSLGPTSSYIKWGTSYLPAWYHDPISRTKAVFGSNGVNVPATASATQQSFRRPDNKLIMADWPWYGNRHYNLEPNQWHTSDPVDRRFSTLFSDAHVELFFFDRDLVEDGKATDGYGEEANLWTHPASPSNPWW